MQNYLKFVKMYADSRYNWSKIAGQWEDVMNSLKARYPNEETRKLPKDDGPMFHYKVK